MPLRRPDEFVADGSKGFRRVPVNKTSILGWVAISQAKVKDSMNTENSTSTRLGAAYDSVTSLSLAVLAAQGWRCMAADGHHVQALEAACATVGTTQAVLAQIDAVRDVRNNPYNGVQPSATDVSLAHACTNHRLLMNDGRATACGPRLGPLQHVLVSRGGDADGGDGCHRPRPGERLADDEVAIPLSEQVLLRNSTVLENDAVVLAQPVAELGNGLFVVHAGRTLGTRMALRPSVPPWSSAVRTMQTLTLAPWRSHPLELHGQHFVPLSTYSPRPLSCRAMSPMPASAASGWSKFAVPPNLPRPLRSRSSQQGTRYAGHWSPASTSVASVRPNRTKPGA